MNIDEYKEPIIVDMTNFKLNISEILNEERSKKLLFRHIVFTREDIAFLDLSLDVVKFQHCLIPKDFFYGISRMINNLKSLLLDDNYELDTKQVLNVLRSNKRLEHLMIHVSSDVQKVFGSFVSRSKTLTKLILSHVEKNPNVLKILVSNNIINNFVMMHTNVDPSLSNDLYGLVQDNKNITRYAFIDCTFEEDELYDLPYILGISPLLGI